MAELKIYPGLIKDGDGSYYDELLSELNNSFEYKSYFKRNVLGLHILEVYNYPILSLIVTQLISIFNRDIDGVFINYYKDGTEYAPYHRDKYDRDLATVSIGSTRDFCVKDENKKVTKYKLNDGDVVYFNKIWNDIHKHSIPIRKKVKEGRISILVFFRD